MSATRALGVGLAALAALVPAACASDEEEATTAASAAAEREVEPAKLHRCAAIPVIEGFRCGELEVPFERADESLGTTRIGFAVRAPNEPGAEADPPIFAVEGGPGYASTLSANTYVKLFGSLLDTHPLVLVDMRGTGRSGPVDCPDVQAGRGPEWITVADCARRLGERYASYRTSAAADDIDDVREALGHERIALYGDSYGTYLGQSYAFRHPDRLDALVLDSAYPARGETAWYSSLPRTGIRSLSVACERKPKCREQGDAQEVLEELTQHLRDTNRGVGPLIDALVDAAYGPPATYLQVVRAGRDLLAGNPGAWRRLTDPGKPGYRKIRDYARAGELVVGCNDYPMIWDRAATEEERRVQLEEAIEAKDPDSFLPFTPREVALSAEIGYLECLTWPARNELYEPPVEADAEPTEAPVLVVSGELDSVTTPREGERVAEEFPNSEFFVARNVGHVHALYNRHGDAATEIRRFLREHIGG